MTELRGGVTAPREFPVLPLRTGVVFPGTLTTLPIGRKRSVALALSVHVGDVVGVVAQRDPSVSDPSMDDLYPMGTFARVAEVQRSAGRDLRLTLEGLGRFRLSSLQTTEPFCLGEGESVPEVGGDSEEAVALAAALKRRVQDTAKHEAGSLGQLASSVAEPGTFADQVASSLGLSTEHEMKALAELDIPARLRLVAELLTQAQATVEVKKKIESEVRQQIGKGQREAILREQLRAIRKELGEDGSGDEVGQLRDRIENAGLPDDARKVADREMRRLETLTPQAPDYNVVRTYLEWIADLPWSQKADVKFDVDGVARKLDQDHYGLAEVKKRILEHIAVLKLAGQAKGSILCLAGPPGVGKTSLGQSIADAMGRPLVRIALGGVRDEAEIRGHRRTYVGALPGRILAAMKRAKVKNPVMLLDEIDKLFTSWSGSPEAALLEVLDPEQNRTFADHYLEIPFDLSEVLFICTANDLSTLSAPLRDRLEIIELGGYTADEKIHIAKRHLLPKQLETHCIPSDSLSVSDRALEAIVRDYTREAGVRQLTREINKLCRAVALETVRAADAKTQTIAIDEHDLSRYLGRVRFFSEAAERTSVPGVATGLAWTPFGGDILFVETSRMPGKGRLEITGQLGDVMKESAKAALSYVRSHAELLGIDPVSLESQDLHIHVPAGAVPKDGPSAGVTMFTALTSLLSDRRVRSDTAMTGECTLRGRVLPVGGIKAKVLAAHRAGISRIVLPEKNARDLEEVPQEVQDAIEFIFASDMSQVISAALEPEPEARIATAAALSDSPRLVEPSEVGPVAGSIPGNLGAPKPQGATGIH